MLWDSQVSEQDAHGNGTCGLEQEDVYSTVYIAQDAQGNGTCGTGAGRRLLCISQRLALAKFAQGDFLETLLRGPPSRLSAPPLRPAYPLHITHPGHCFPDSPSASPSFILATLWESHDH